MRIPAACVRKSCFSLCASGINNWILRPSTHTLTLRELGRTAAAAPHRSDKSNNKESLSLWRHTSIFHALHFLKGELSHCSKAENRLWLCNFSSPSCFHPFLRPPFVRMGLGSNKRGNVGYFHTFFIGKRQREAAVWCCPRQICIEMREIQKV